MLPIQQLPALNTNSSEESLHFPIQLPSPINTQYPSHVVPQIKRKAVPGRHDSATLPADAFVIEPATRLKVSRVDLLNQQLTPKLFTRDPAALREVDDRAYGIKMRLEPDQSIRSPISPEGDEQAAIYQAPADMPWLQQSYHDPEGRLKAVRAQQKLKRENHVQRGKEQPRQRLQERMKHKAEKEYVVLANIRSDRSQLQRTRQWLNGRNEDEPLLASREKEDSLADMFDRENEARRNGERRRMPPQKLKKPVEGRRGGVEGSRVPLEWACRGPSPPRARRQTGRSSTNRRRHAPHRIAARRWR